jgi:hypothetical protein
MSVVPTPGGLAGFDAYNLDVAQWAVAEGGNKIVGGMRVVIRTRDIGTLFP